MVRIVASSWAQLVGKQDWNHRRECPTLKTGLWEVLWLFGCTWTGLLCVGLQSRSLSHLDQGLGQSKSWLPSKQRAWVSFSLDAAWQQSRRISLSLVLTQSQAMTGEWPRLGKCRSTLTSWGFGVTSLTLSPPSAFVLHLLPQAGQSRKSVRWDAEGEGWWRKRWRWKEASGRGQKVPVR